MISRLENQAPHIISWTNVPEQDSLTRFHSTKRRILNYLLYLDQFEVIFPSYAKIAQHAGISERQAQRHVSSLIKEGYITKLSRPVMPNIYTIADFFYHDETVNRFMHLLPALEFIQKKKKNVPKIIYSKNIGSTTKNPSDVTLLNVNSLLYKHNNPSVHEDGILYQQPIGKETPPNQTTHQYSSTGEYSFVNQYESTNARAREERSMKLEKELKKMGFDDHQIERLHSYPESVIKYGLGVVKKRDDLVSPYGYLMGICKKRSLEVNNTQSAMTVSVSLPEIPPTEKKWQTDEITQETYFRLHKQVYFAQKSLKAGRDDYIQDPSDVQGRLVNEYQKQLDKRTKRLNQFTSLYNSKFNTTEPLQEGMTASSAQAIAIGSAMLDMVIPETILEQWALQMSQDPSYLDKYPLAQHMVKQYLQTRCKVVS